MDVSAVSPAVTNASQPTTVAIEVQKKSEEIQKQTATDLVAAIPDPDSSLGQNIDIKV